VKGSARRTRRLAVLGLLVAAAALVAGTVHAGPTNSDDARNASFGLTYNGNPTQDCWKHHKSEGMTDSHVVIPIFPKAIKKGEPTELQLQVENSWKYDIAELKVNLNFPDNDTFIVPLVGSAAESPPPYTNHWTGVVGNPRVPTAPPHKHEVTFTVEPNAVALIAYGEMFYPPGPGLLQNKALFNYTLPAHSRSDQWPGQSDGSAQQNLTLPYGTGADTIRIPSGEWKLSVDYTNGEAAQVPFSLNVTVVYQAAGSHEFVVFEQLRNPPMKGTKPVSLIPPRGVSDIIKIPVLGIAEGTQHVEVNVTALLYYKHQAGGTPDEDSFYRVATQSITVGDTYVASDVQAATGGTVQVDFYMMSGEVTGFAAAFLLLPSLLLGGTYGRASRKFLNDVLGGAKRRVMFHNLVSLGLTLVALVHVVLFLLEVRYTVLMGVLFGGLGALSLLILGLTGYYQVPLIQKYGYNWWRFIHLAVGLLVVVFVGYHAVADGPDFFFIKKQLPEWLNAVNSAQK
jgi:hypothetical protein